MEAARQRRVGHGARPGRGRRERRRERRRGEDRRQRREALKRTVVMEAGLHLEDVDAHARDRGAVGRRARNQASDRRHGGAGRHVERGRRAREARRGDGEDGARPGLHRRLREIRRGQSEGSGRVKHKAERVRLAAGKGRRGRQSRGRAARRERERVRDGRDQVRERVRRAELAAEGDSLDTGERRTSAPGRGAGDRAFTRQDELQAGKARRAHRRGRYAGPEEG